MQVVIYVSPNNPGAIKAAQMLKRSQPKLGITQLPPTHGKKPEEKALFGSVLGAVDSAVHARPCSPNACSPV